MATYNGHKNWNHWNVSLWINNDEGLYLLAKNCRRVHRSVARAAELFISRAGKVTPDGAPYSKSSVSAAIKDI